MIFQATSECVIVCVRFDCKLVLKVLGLRYCCQIMGCYGQRLEITNMNMNMSLYLEYQSELIFIFS